MYQCCQCQSKQTENKTFKTIKIFLISLKLYSDWVSFHTLMDANTLRFPKKFVLHFIHKFVSQTAETISLHIKLKTPKLKIFFYFGLLSICFVVGQTKTSNTNSTITELTQCHFLAIKLKSHAEAKEEIVIQFQNTEVFKICFWRCSIFIEGSI